VDVISAYIATFLVVFTAVGVMLYICAYYLTDDLSMNLIEYYPSASQNSI